VTNTLQLDSRSVQASADVRTTEDTDPVYRRLRCGGVGAELLYHDSDVGEGNDRHLVLREVQVIDELLGGQLGLTQKRPALTRSFADVKREIQTRLLQEKRAKRMDEWVAEMRRQMKVETFEDRLNQVKVGPTAANAISAPAVSAKAASGTRL